MKTDVLLINPPFSMPDKPCISIPTLSAYLKKKGIQAQGLDANIEFYRRFLSPENIRSSREYAHKRIVELNEKQELQFSEIVEYSRLVEVLQAVSNVEQKLFSLFEPYSFSNVETFALFRIALRLASVPHFPECLEPLMDGAGYIRHVSRHHKFSTSDIIASLAKTTLCSNYLEDIILPVVEQYNPPLVGISLSFHDQILPTFQCARIIKKHFPDIHVTIGGSSVSAYMRELSDTRLFEVVDSFVLDDGEIPLESLSREISSNAPDLSCIPGLMYLSEEGKVIKNVSAISLCEDIFDAPDYSIFPLERYLIKKESMALLFRLSRGCYWARCTFCRTELPLIYAHFQPSTLNLFNQLKTTIEQTGVRIYHFSDNAASPDTLEELSRMILQHKLKINWVVNLRFDKSLTTERLRLYKQAGCRSIYLGLESYSPRIMKLMKKGISEELVEKVLSNIALVGIPVKVYMIVGFPTETVEEAQESFSKILKLKERGLIQQYIYNVCMINPYSELASHPEKFGITKIVVPEGEDLLPPITYFESPGMTREQAFNLLSTFIKRRNNMDTQDGQTQRTTLSSIMVDGEALKLHFSLDKIQATILNVLTSEGFETYNGLNRNEC